MDQPNTKEQTKEELTFKFRFKSESEPFALVCNTSMTVLEALNASPSFTKMNKSSQKEIVIQRPDGAAVNTDFPCCLIEKDEILTITFLKNEKEDFTGQQTHKALSHRRADLVTFNIETTGGKNVTSIMKNNKLKSKADYVCVHALKGEEVKTALERDGRLNTDKIFNEKHCVLSEKNVLGNQTKYEMSHPVVHLDKKKFKIIENSHNPPASKLKKQTEVKNESDVASNPSVLAKNDPDQNPISTDQKETLHNKVSTSLSTKWPVIPHSTEILKILRDQFKDLLETLKQRENLNNPQVQKFFRAEYDKSVQSFSDVYKIKKLMSLSDSVCQIRVEGIASGTGFLLFGRFVLTNAHVVRKYLESPDKLSSAKHIKAAFDFERLGSEVKLVPVLAAYCFTDANNSWLDLALLELDDADKITGHPGHPGLLSRYRARTPPNCGGICIVGHPDSGIKRMDPCFIIENLRKAADEHISENVEFIQVMTQRSLEDKWGIHENQITYDSCFFYGSSGSPVFDEDCNLIGVHTGGYVYKGEKDKDRSIMEYAYSMQPILDIIRAQAEIKGLHEVVSTLEAHSNESGTAE